MPLLAGLVPFFILVTTTSGGLMVAGGFLIAYTIAHVSTLYMPPVFSKPVVFVASILFSSVGVSLYASLIRIIDPFLYERFFTVLYMVCFSAPVYQVAGIANIEPDRDRSWEQLAHGLGLAVAIVVVGLLRELLTTGSVMISLEPENHARTILAFIAQPSGAFILLALLLASGRLAARILKRSTV
jgi:Na+-translocating ferredoxin:NAD+ oxidoreductase RnfE subunit